MTQVRREPGADPRRERQREATYDEIVRASRELLAEGAELSLRAVAARMGMTAPALYRYVASYQELVDLVAFEIDKAATGRSPRPPSGSPEDDYAGRLVLATVEFRQWALANPREFALVFANPVADRRCVRRELLTVATSGLLFTDLMRELWRKTTSRIPTLDELDRRRCASDARDPLIPAKVEDIPPEHRGLVWVYMQGWTSLYGVVTLEVFGHMDPRIIEGGEMFTAMVRRVDPPPRAWPTQYDRLDALMVDGAGLLGLGCRAARRPSAGTSSPAGP